MELKHAKHYVCKIRRHMVFCEIAYNDSDHNHLLVDTESKYSPSRVVQIIKSITVRQTIKGYPAIKNSLGVVNYEVKRINSTFGRLT